MFNLFIKNKPKLGSADLNQLGVDFHSHLIPSVDDGSQSLEETRTILQFFKDLGYQKIYTSPHIMGEHFTNTKSDLETHFQKLKTETSIQDIEIEFELIAEYLLDEAFEKLLLKDEFLTINNKYILIETSMNYDFPFVKDYIFELIKMGYQPILAHPERYRYIQSEKNYIERYEEYLDMGLEFQLNMFSLIGLYGAETQKVAENLIEQNFYSYACSDLHRSDQIKFFEKLKKSLFLEKLISSGTLKNKEFLS